MEQVKASVGEKAPGAEARVSFRCGTCHAQYPYTQKAAEVAHIEERPCVWGGCSGTAAKVAVKG